MIKVIVVSATGAARVPAELCEQSGILKYCGVLGTYSHISAEIGKGKSIEVDNSPVEMAVVVIEAPHVIERKALTHRSKAAKRAKKKV